MQRGCCAMDAPGTDCPQVADVQFGTHRLPRAGMLARRQRAKGFDQSRRGTPMPQAAWLGVVLDWGATGSQFGADPVDL